MTARGWTSSDVERWMESLAWQGDRAAGTLGEVRRAVARLATSWGLEVDEVVTFFWEALQAPSLARADNKAAYVWRSVCQQVSTHAAGRDLLQGERAASTLKRDITNGCGDIEDEVRQARRAAGRDEQVVHVPARVGDDDLFADVPAVLVDSEPVEAVETAIALLVDAGWSQGRARRLVDTLVAQAETISSNGASGFGAIANRLRRRQGGAGRGGVSRAGWLAAIRLVFGSRLDTPGVLPRVLGGEDPNLVRQCSDMRALAVQITGRIESDTKLVA